MMRKLCEALVISLVGKELAETWWNSANKAFDGKTPGEIYNSNPERVYNYLMRSADEIGRAHV